jgi:hypothetical protein
MLPLVSAAIAALTSCGSGIDCFEGSLATAEL